jgi:hypothetical protein
MKHKLFNQFKVLEIYRPEKTVLLDDLIYLILEISGMVRVSHRSLIFLVYNKHFFHGTERRRPADRRRINITSNNGDGRRRRRGKANGDYSYTAGRPAAANATCLYESTATTRSTGV